MVNGLAFQRREMDLNKLAVQKRAAYDGCSAIFFVTSGLWAAALVLP